MFTSGDEVETQPIDPRQRNGNRHDKGGGALSPRARPDQVPAGQTRLVLL